MFQEYSSVKLKIKECFEDVLWTEFVYTSRTIPRRTFDLSLSKGRRSKSIPGTSFDTRAFSNGGRLTGKGIDFVDLKSYCFLARSGLIEVKCGENRLSFSVCWL